MKETSRMEMDTSKKQKRTRRCKGQPKDVQEISQRYHAWAPKQLRICPPDHWPSDFKGRDRSEGAVGRLLPGTMPKRPQRGLEQVPEEEEAGNSLTWGRLTFSRVEFINHLEFFFWFQASLLEVCRRQFFLWLMVFQVRHSNPIPTLKKPHGPMVSRGCLILRVMGLPACKWMIAEYQGPNSKADPMDWANGWRGDPGACWVLGMVRNDCENVTWHVTPYLDLGWSYLRPRDGIPLGAFSLSKLRGGSTATF